MPKSSEQQKPEWSGPYSARILKLLKRRGLKKTVCPSEVLPPHRKQMKVAMDQVRKAALQLQKAGKVEILRGGKPVKPGSKGPIRLRLMVLPPDAER